MIKKIIFSLILLCLFIAIPLAILGIERVDIGPSFMAFMKSCNNELNEFVVKIPDIPKIKKFEDASGFLLVLDAIISFFNIIIGLINTFTDVINAIISLIQFIVIVIKNLITFKETLESASIPVQPLTLLMSLSGA